jgi:hypothetical protein
MTTTVRVACPSGSGVHIKYGTQVAEIPVGGVHTFYLYNGVQASAVITELGAPQTGDSPADVPAVDTAALTAENECLKAEITHLTAQLEAASKAAGIVASAALAVSHAVQDT